MCSLSDTTIMKETAAVLQPAPSLGAYVEKVHPHKFRRTMATRAIEKGA